MAVALGIAASLAAPASAQDMPRSFVYLRDIDPTIRQDMRYAGTHNFQGKPSKGYLAAECILTRKAAEALQRVQAALAQEGLYSLKVYDCYRPVRAVGEFAAWSRNPRDAKMKREFYPDLDKRNLFSLGFIAKRSVHSKGSAIDLTLVPLGSAPPPPYVEGGPLTSCTAPRKSRAPDDSLDFGTGYDCFSELSHTRHPRIKGEAKANREKLVAAMAAEGFENYRREWWHFELPGGGAPEGQDFVIAPHPEGAPDARPQAPAPKPATPRAARKPPPKPEAEPKRPVPAALAPSKPPVEPPRAKVPQTRQACGKDGQKDVLLTTECAYRKKTIVLWADPNDAKPRESIPETGQVMRCRQCRGTHAFAEFGQLSPADRAKADAPWCQVDWQGDTADAKFSGWIRATRLREAGTHCPAEPAASAK